MQDAQSNATSAAEPVSWMATAVIALFVLYVLGGLVSMHFMHRADLRKRRFSASGIFDIALGANALGFFIWLLVWPALIAFHHDGEDDDTPEPYLGPKA